MRRRSRSMKPKKYKKQEIIRVYSILLILIVLSWCSSVPDAASIKVTRINDTILKLCVDDFVNLVAFIGPEGVLLVDTGFDESSGQVKSILKEHGGGNIEYIINTHSDYDHIAGNSALRGNAMVLAHTHCKSQLIEYADPEYDIPFDKALFRGAYPTITFEEPVTLYFNGDEIQVIPLTGGHTDEDVIVYFKKSGVVCLGDMISPGTFPVVKLNNGGNAHTLVENVKRLISLFPEDVTFIVGHGAETTVKELRIYHHMLQSTIAIVQEAMKANMTVEEMKQRNILEDWSSFNDPKYEETTAETWIETIYRSYEERKNEIKDSILKGAYLGQNPPGMTPIAFAPNIISTNEYHQCCSGFMAGGAIFIFSPIIPGSDWKYKPTYFMQLKDGKWTKPKIVPFNNLFPYNFTVAPDGHTLYFTSLRSAGNSSILLKIPNIWFVQYGNKGWTEARMLGPELNPENYVVNYPSVSNSGNIYYSSDQPPCLGKGDIFFSKFAEGKFLEKQNLGEMINTEYSEDDPFIASDESFLIFCSSRPGGYGSYDLYIAFRKKNGTWTKAKNMGPEINTPGEEARPSITPDGKYFFFTRGDVNPDWRDIFWVDARIITRLKSTQFK